MIKKLIKEKITKTKKDSLDRLYLIGKEYEEAGFSKELIFSYDIDFKNKTIKINKDKEKFSFGKGRVSGKKLNDSYIPVLDINNKKIREVFKNICKCTVKIYEGEIVITPFVENNSTFSTSGIKIIDFFKFKNKKKKKQIVIKTKNLDFILKNVVNGYEQLSIFDYGFTCSNEETEERFLSLSKNTNINDKVQKVLNLTTLLSDYTYFELFAGSGAGAICLEKFGANSRGYSEIDPYAIKCYEANLKGHINYGDITKINEKTLPKFDFLIFGSPCTDFSIMKNKWEEDKKAKGLEGDESKTFLDAVRILNHCRPKWFIFENVREVINRKDDFKVMIELLGTHYNLEYKVLNTSDFGIPQTRRRLYIVGQLKSLGDFNYEFPTPIPLKLKMKDLLDKNVDFKYFITEKYLPTIMSTGTNGWYAKAEIDLDIARPITKTCHKMHRASQDNYISCDIIPPKGKTNIRRLTPRECARLQGFDDDYNINSLSDTRLYQLFGNSFSCNVIYKIIENLAIYINNTFIKNEKVITLKQ